ncbi:MAG: hypothetical protein KAS48_04750 [Gammaproteobacteria bacterium]|nr:hypothetical protein [Gammaproteobacteria bacterium]
MRQDSNLRFNPCAKYMDVRVSREADCMEAGGTTTRKWEVESRQDQ